VRRLAIALLFTPLVGMAGLSLLAPAAHAGTVPPDSAVDVTAISEEGEVASDLAPVDVLQVSGLFDDVQVQSVKDAIVQAEANGSQALILQMSTEGAIVSNDDMRDLLQSACRRSCSAWPT
jgi:membrane-bound serine protease (ClpP class)